MSIDSIELLSARSWHRVTFTTYALSLSFFESVPLVPLTKTGSQNVTILSDVDGVRAALGEQGARRAGKDYQVEPVSVAKGVFHPKMTVLSAQDDCHLLIGSGNLTFGGWGNNLEVLEHLHPSFAAEVFEEAAVFFETLGTQSRIRQEAGRTLDAVSSDLRRAARSGGVNSHLRLIHNLTASIMSQVAQVAEDLGGATRITAASPFWGADALDQFATALGQERVFIHSHEHGTVRGKFGTNWPAKAKTKVVSGLLEPLRGADSGRRLHAKLVEVICRKGRIVVSGSANMTSAALTSLRNVETCLLRISPQKSGQWGWEAAPAPLLTTATDDDAENTESIGVLRAELVNDQIHGILMDIQMSGPANVFRVTAEGLTSIGATEVDAKQRFVITAAELERLAWKDERLTLRIELGTLAAEGFVALPAFSGIRQRIGAAASHIFAIMNGTGTPRDLAAVMDWFRMNPEVIGTAVSGGTGGSDKPENGDVKFVLVAELVDSDSDLSVAGAHHATSSQGWKRFMQNLLAAFRCTQKDNRLENTPDGDDDVGEEDSGAPEPAAARAAWEEDRGTAFESFERLLDLLLSEGQTAWHGVVAFDLVNYISLRLDPDERQVISWLDRVIRFLVAHGGATERKDAIAAAVLAVHARQQASKDRDRNTRLRLLRLGIDMSGDAPGAGEAEGFKKVLSFPENSDEIWQALRNARSLQEQVAAYVGALDRGVPSAGDYLDIAAEAPEAWKTLETAFGDQDSADAILRVREPFSACPKCHRVLPVQDTETLRTVGIGIARNCCQRILLCGEI